MNILAIIPARGGSKGIPRKNIKFLAGKPLIAYSIETVAKSKYVDKIVVSTEDPEIKDISKSYGVEIINRPKELAKDDSPTIDAVAHSLNSLEKDGYLADIIVLLQPTSPLRTEFDIDNSIDIFMKNNCEAVVSICTLDHSPHLSFKIEKGYLKSFFGNKYLSTRRQDLPLLYRPNGAIYIIKPRTLYKYKSFYPPNTIPYIMPIERSIDIDNEFDFFLSEFLISNEFKECNNE